MPNPRVLLLLAGLTWPALSDAQTPPRTANQAAEDSRREIERSRQESRDNLERGKRGEIDPAQVRRERSARTPQGSSVPPEVIARWQNTDPKNIQSDADFIEALRRQDPAALAHYEGILDEIHREARTAIDSRQWMGGARLDEARDRLDLYRNDRDNHEWEEWEAPEEDPGIRRRPDQMPKKPPRKRPREEEREEQPERNPIHERDALERGLDDAHRQYDRAARQRDDNPNDPELQNAARRAEEHMNMAEERYQDFLGQNAPNELRARLQERDALQRRMEDPKPLTRDQLPPRREGDERPRTPELQDYEGRRGVNPDHILHGPNGEQTVLGLDRGQGYERPATPRLNDYGGRQGTNPDHVVRGPEGMPDRVLPGRSPQPSPERPGLDLNPYDGPKGTGPGDAPPTP